MQKQQGSRDGGQICELREVTLEGCQALCVGEQLRCLRWEGPVVQEAGQSPSTVPPSPPLPLRGCIWLHRQGVPEMVSGMKKRKSTCGLSA